MIFYLLPRAEWTMGGATVAAPGPDGFVHCCDEGQLTEVRRNYFPADVEVVALAIDPTVLTAETRYEPGAGGESQRFPHVYGSIARDDVLAVHEVPLVQP